MVKKGDVLAVLDRSALDTQLAQIDASRAQAEATIAQMHAQIGDTEVGVRQAQEAFDRAKALQVKGVAAKMQLDNAVNGYDSAQREALSARRRSPPPKRSSPSSTRRKRISCCRSRRPK